MPSSYRTLKLGCYSINVTMSIVGNLPPILFLGFRSLYGLSFTQLGLLVTVNFLTQLAVDLIFSFFSHRFHIPRTLKFTPVLASAGLLIYLLSPLILPRAIFAGLLLGTVIFSAASGLGEVLISPVIAAIPAEDPEREMSKLHSVYAWGAVFIILVSTLFLLAFGAEAWPLLTALFTLIPLGGTVLLARAQIPPMETPARVSGALRYLRLPSLWLCVIAIFLGGAAECTMAQWASGYLEGALGIPKIWGDVFGVALFSVMLGLGRTLYGKFGKNLGRILFLGGIGATACYLIAAISPDPVLGLLACAMTGFCASILWPGCLVVASERFPESGVFIYAMMAAGGDLGASLGPQLIGVVTDTALTNPALLSLASNLNLSPEAFGLKLGMLIGMLFPLCSIPVYFHIMKKREKQRNIQI